MENPTEVRPWGSFKVLHDSDFFKVKILEVLPDRRLSYQRHELRSERWTVVSGAATVILDDVESTHKAGDVVFVERGQKHRLINNHREILTVVEVQVGDYFGEDDIERFEDDYGRVS
jgi:mannose-6-phosphate isomerase-like protein (cupin superfamily)